jgi:cold shock CspA family protein
MSTPPLSPHASACSGGGYPFELRCFVAVGQINYWNNERGFGRISDYANREARGNFVHLNNMPDRCEPTLGDEFSYDVMTERDGRTSARNLRALTVEQAEARRVLG